MDFEQKVRTYIEQKGMLIPGECVLVGLSGGADSLALIEALYHMATSLHISLMALHVHHGIRAEADRDVEFCRKYCLEKGIAFYCEYVNVPEYALQYGMSEEEAGRSLRYQLFDKYCKEYGLDKVAVAHHQNDQAETMLFQLFRGSGLKGLTGIPATREKIIRPLLHCTRQEIESYLKEKSLSYIVDETNLKDDYSRNKIRNHIIPIAEEISEGAVGHMNQTGELLLEIYDYLEIQKNQFIQSNVTFEQGKVFVKIKALKTQHIALQRMIVLHMLEILSGSRKNITQKHVQSVVDLLSKQGEKSMDLPYGIRACKEYEQLIMVRGGDVARKIVKQTRIFLSENEKLFLEDGSMIETRLIPVDNLENIPKSDCIKWFDYDKISCGLTLRTREQGDYLTIRNDGARKSLQDYLVNEKVPKSLRDRVWVLADGNHIVWIPGKRISAYYKVTEQTKRILQVRVEGINHG